MTLMSVVQDSSRVETRVTVGILTRRVCGGSIDSRGSAASALCERTVFTK